MWGVAGRLRSEFLLGQPPFTVCMESPAGILWATGPAGLSTSVDHWRTRYGLHGGTYIHRQGALDYQNSPFMQDLGITVIPDPGWMSLSESLVHIAKGGWPYKQEFTSRSASHPPHTAGVGRPTGPDAQSMSAGPDMQIADGGWPCKQEFSPRPASHPPHTAGVGRPLGQMPKACRPAPLCRLQRKAGPARIHSQASRPPPTHCRGCKGRQAQPEFIPRPAGHLPHTAEMPASQHMPYFPFLMLSSARNSPPLLLCPKPGHGPKHFMLYQFQFF
ncbi:uncharacterized protein EDB91DRAFT_1090503 [Suillus paluster]|uniref:uncharacterized protein n=1 Tax=Suillus paluster TaxID=48578 RepID=UPI001B86BA47|nr:uncharacterized protein EDB91DRAFT_1090503 [Suillus paluster]KAG1717875.1 hypothetical protein EDB91DRAFT_1090503 [Suillus paluster]